MCDLQTPVQQEELLQQISAILMGKTTAATLNGKDITTDTAGGTELQQTTASDEGETKTTAPAPTSTLTDVLQQPTTLAYYSGISFVRDSEALKTGHDEDEEDNAEDDDGDETSSDEEEYDDDDDYDEYFLNETLDNEAALTSYRSEASGGTSGGTGMAATTSSGKQGDIHDFLSKHSRSDTSSIRDG